jgi:hypothetical protein
MRGQLASVGQTRFCLMHSQDAAVTSQSMRDQWFPRDLRLSRAAPSCPSAFPPFCPLLCPSLLSSNSQQLLAAHADPTAVALKSDTLSLSCRCRLTMLLRTHTRWRCGANSALPSPEVARINGLARLQ